MKIVCTSPSFAKYSAYPYDLLKAAGVTLENLPADISEADFIARAADADGAIVAFNPMTEAVFSSLPNLKVVSKHGVGVDNIDLAAAQRHGVRITNVPAANRHAVADFTFALLLSLARDLPRVDAATRAGEWPRCFGHDVHSMTLGIVGIGSIGQAVAKRATGFEMRVLAYDPFANPEAVTALGVELVDLDTLCREADFLTLHVGLSEQTHHLINTERLALMKPTAMLINAARGGIVDEQALYESLKEKRLAGAAIDAFEQEPLTSSPLYTLDNVIVSSHIAGYTENALTTLSTTCVEDVLAVLRGKEPKHPVNA
ncbi:4-phosphoerythronate dehydrogenase [Vreelandella olivaria]|uniref:4-phosphoerythronate dehydrogenase n=1 Tax=Vreelandella olivaria TaxID=390919 RepID=A0ABN5WLM8_9GAMM|nr:4-phosphoerythronate dehydrogenase [Halomonas olivaria]